MPALDTMELERLIVIMREMQLHATSANWQELARLDKERRTLLKFDATTRLSHTKPPPFERLQKIPDAEQKPTVSSNTSTASRRDGLVQEIRKLDKQIIDEVMTARAKLLAENRGLNAQVKARNLYAEASAIT